MEKKIIEGEIKEREGKRGKDRERKGEEEAEECKERRGGKLGEKCGEEGEK